MERWLGTGFPSQLLRWLVLILVSILDRIVVRQRLAGVTRWNENVKLLVQHMAPRYQLLDASTANRLTDVQVAFRVCRDGMQEREFARLVAGAAEAGENPLAGHRLESFACKGSYAVKDPQDF